MKKIIIFSVAAIGFFAACAEQNHSIEGVWTSLQEPYMRNRTRQMPNGRYVTERVPLEEIYDMYELSWGSRPILPVWEMMFDLRSDPQLIRVSWFEWKEITVVDERGRETEIRFYFENGDLYASVLFCFNRDGTMWIKSSEPSGFTPYGVSGRNRIFRKIDGP